MTQQSLRSAVLRLVINGQVQSDASFPLGINTATVLGREADCDLVLDTCSEVSRHHARIWATPAGEWMIEDLGSSNGTYVNGQAVRGHQGLKQGDRFQLAQEGPEFQFEAEPNLVQTPQTSSAPAQRTIEARHYRIEISPARLVIKKKDVFANSLLITVIAMAVLSSLFFPLVPVILLVFALNKHDCAYLFDLESGQLTCSQISVVSRLLRFRHRKEYPLRDFTAVRLQRSEYDNDSASYNIFLDRENGKPVQLNFNWQQNWFYRQPPPVSPPDAEQIVEIIQEFLTRA